MSQNGNPSRGPIPGVVVGQYFGIFNGVPKEHYQKIVAAAPFELCNLLILAFVHTVEKKGNYVAAFTQGRDEPMYPAQDGDMDEDRVRLVVDAARAKNKSLKILISLGWDRDANKPGDVVDAAKTPDAFADSVADIVREFGLDGLDIDYESERLPDDYAKAKDMLALVQALKTSLSRVEPKREMILTITPAREDGLDADVLNAVTYVMPQTYENGGNGTTADPYKVILKSFDRIVYGINSEGYIGDSDDPSISIGNARTNRAAGVFAWRLDNDAVDEKTRMPTFMTAKQIWSTMKETAAPR